MGDWITPAIAVIGVAGAGGVLKLVHWMGKVDEQRSVLSGFVERIASDIAQIRRDINQMFLRLPSPTVAGGSPTRLTDTGREIAAALEAEEWARRLAPGLLAQVAGMVPFEVDDFAATYVQQHLSDDLRRLVAARAYEHGIDRPSVRDVLRVVLRDELLRRLEAPPVTD